MFPMTITISNHSQLNAVLAALGSETPTVTAAEVRQYRDENQTSMKDAKQAVQQAKAEAKKPQASTPAKTQEAPAPTPPTAEAAGADAPASKAEDSAPAQSGNDEPEQPWNAQDYKNLPEYQAVAKAVVEVAKVKGREAAAALLEKTAGVKSLPESLPSQGAAIIAAFQAEGV